MSEKLGQLLLRDGIVNRDQLDMALNLQREKGGSLGESLVAVKAITSVDDIAWPLAEQLNTQVVNLAEMEVQPELLSYVPEEMALKFGILPIGKEERLLHVVLSDPRNIAGVDAIKFLTGLNIKVWVSPESQLRQSLERYYVSKIDSGEMKNILQDMEDFSIQVVDDKRDDDEASGDYLDQVIEAPLVRLVNKLIADAIRLRASDIHVEAYEKVIRVRYRLDGTLVEQTPLPYKLKNAIVSRLKIMSNLDISERRLPQDGRIKMVVGRKKVDLRVNTLPTVYGEKVVMRILDPENLKLDLNHVGFSERSLRDFRSAVASPFGMVLVTGPTGSGKTTTLYSALHSVNKSDVNIMTAEDPVEYNLEGINQVQVNSDIGLTFASALRAFLRQDPDIILVGEIRDLETAQIAVKAALTGHLVLSTLHTNDAPSTISRLSDMGIEPFLIASSVRIITAQRLIRKLCPKCKREASAPDAETLEVLGMSSDEAQSIQFFDPKGCDNCAKTGYKGRMAIHQVMPISDSVRTLIMDRATPDEIQKEAMSQGVQSLRMAALDHLRSGETSPQEVIKTTTA